MRTHLILKHVAGGYETHCGQTVYDPDLECGTKNRLKCDCLMCLNIVYAPAEKLNQAVKLNWSAVHQIRSDYQKGVRGHGIKALAKREGVAVTTVRNIVQHTRWKD